MSITTYVTNSAAALAAIAASGQKHVWIDGARTVIYTGADIPETLTQVPSEVTARQLRLALNQLGMRAAVEAYVAAGSQDLRDWWEYEVSLQRRHALMLQAQSDLALTDAQGDAIFALAGTL